MGENTPDDSGVTTLATQGGITFFGSIIGRGLGFVFTIGVTKLVSASTFGVYSLGLAIVLFTKSIADLSVYRGIDYYIPQYLLDENYDEARNLFATISVIALLGTGLAVIVLWSFTPYLSSIFGEDRLTAILPVLALALPFLSFRDVTVRMFIAIKQLRYRVLLTNLLLPGGKLFITLVLIFAGYKLQGLVLGYLSSIIIVAFAGIVYLRRRVSWLFNGSIEGAELNNLFSYALPLVFAGVIHSTISQIDFFIIGYYPNTTSEDLAIYKVANLLGINLLIFLNSLAPVFKPMVTEVKQDDQLLNSRYALAARWILLFSLPVALTLILAPRTYLSLLFTRVYAAGSGALIILVLGYLVNSSVGPEGMVLEGLGFTKLTLANTALIVSVNAVLDILLIPRLGILGAAIGTAVGITCGVTAGVLELHYLRGLFPFEKRTIYVFLSGVPPLSVGWIATILIDSKLLLAVSLPFIILGTYLIFLRIFNVFGEEDRLVAELLEKKTGIDLIGWFIHSK
ncbi:oligosaccharide flippase family protein [Halorubrum halodurans]|uniref:Uncharacterized protein n=1 Tax=Halorubrum halodurans TaxID=1383851 RepID=A0A256II46_9EURY|nr:oligosaccharide flippase family protein [Halorubrum halodurans]OYR55807.1 hypothetical protein DJ70_10850 [Halorubrum halodurans]